MEISKGLIEKVIDRLGFSSLNRIQKVMMKEGIHPGQIVLYAPTGTGKTVSYLLVILHYLECTKSGVQAMVIVPSRELALQIEQVFRQMDTGWKVNSCYGGHPLKTELNNFREPPALVIGTPGRIADHLRRGSFNADFISSIVVDEFDKSLELGFDQEMQFIFGKLKNVRKRILTSATNNLEIPEYTGMTEPLYLDFLQDTNQSKIKIKAIRSEGNDKLESLKGLISRIGNEPTLVFCNHRDAVERISKLLNDTGIVHDIFHGGLEQEKRERALIKFRNGSLTLLVTTDLAARGLDIPEIRNIIHYQLSAKKNEFIHRNGRTARMNSDGTVWLLLSEAETLPSYLEEMPEIETLAETTNLPDPPEWITLYIGGGKKGKIGKKDIVGFLIQQGGLTKEEIGQITVQDYSSFAAVKRERVRKISMRLKGLKLKGRNIKIAISD